MGRSSRQRCTPVLAVVEARFQAAHGQQHAVQVLVARQDDHRRPRPRLRRRCCSLHGVHAQELCHLAVVLDVDHLPCNEVMTNSIIFATAKGTASRRTVNWLGSSWIHMTNYGNAGDVHRITPHHTDSTSQLRRTSADVSHMGVRSRGEFRTCAGAVEVPGDAAQGRREGRDAERAQQHEAGGHQQAADEEPPGAAVLAGRCREIHRARPAQRQVLVPYTPLHQVCLVLRSM